MLTNLRVRNFKSWRDTGDVRLAPLTVIFGANSAGKSSLAHLLLVLKQTALSTDRKQALDLGDANALIDLGAFSDVIFDHDVERRLEFDLGWTIPGGLEVRNAISTREKFSGDSLSLHAELTGRRSGQVVTSGLSYELSSKRGVELEAHIAETRAGRFSVTARPLQLRKSVGRGWPIDEPEKFYRLSERSIARYQNAGFLTDFALATEVLLRSLYFLGPLRAPPRRLYQWSGASPADVGALGQTVVAAMLAADQQKRHLNLGKYKPLRPFGVLVADQLKAIGVIHDFRVQPIAAERKDYEVLVRTHADAPEVKLTDVGVGVSQVLPAVVQAFYCPPSSTVWMEQPEIHLHPRVQADLADVFINAILACEKGHARNTQIVVESHSEHFLSRIQRRVAEGMVGPNDVAVYFAKRAGAATELEPLVLTRDGEIENWPQDFFGDQMADIAGRVVAAAERHGSAEG